MTLLRAFRANTGRYDMQIAIVADQSVPVPMVGECDTAIRALEHEFTAFTLQVAGKAPAIIQDKSLAVFRERFAEQVVQSGRDMP